MNDGIRFSELLAYTAEENRRWKEWFQKHPQAMEVPCDIAGPTVHHLLLHIFTADLLFAHRLLGLAPPDFKPLPHATIDELFAIGEGAAEKMSQFMERARSEDWNELVPLGSRDLKPSKRKMMAQAELHGVHHRAQLATLLRQQGYKQDWIHDILLSDAMR
ncbi:MAG: hypothetical protein LAO56_04810 [Acidobacteriia bacterium]|nr:hypothetical protein [Terriglobia bacterium]